MERGAKPAMTKLRSDSVDGIPVLCEECGTVITKDTEQSAKETAESHNDSRHNGDTVAVAVVDEYDVDTSKANNQDRFERQIWELVK